jgi:hypothetical protein
MQDLPSSDDEDDNGSEGADEDDNGSDDDNGDVDELRALTVPWIVMAAGCCISWIIVTGCVAIPHGWEF